MKCPGQDSRFWGHEAIFETCCPDCGQPIEFFKDESTRRCRTCGRKVINPRMDLGCAAYCRFAAQCLGTSMPAEILRMEICSRDRVALEVKKLLGRDFKRIGKSLKVAEYAGELQRSEGGDPAIVTIAAFLSSIAGRERAEQAVGGPLFSPEDIAEAEAILLRARAPGELTRGVLAVLNDPWRRGPGFLFVRFQVCPRRSKHCQPDRGARDRSIQRPSIRS